MKVEVKCGIHNRFDIEVRDAVTGELKRTAYAENMILDRGFSRVLNFQSYFTYIHFGKGDGAITADRTTLFESLGYKTAEVVERDYSLPTSKYVQKIQVNPDEFVGETFTEVGISETTTDINTHALIKDAEGNTLSLTKQPLEVLIIYATVFVTLNNANGVSFSVAENNRLLKYFLEGSAVTTYNSYISLGSSNINSPSFIGLEESFKGFVITRDVTKKEVYFSNRFEIQDGNGNIREIGLYDILRSKITDIHPPVNVTGFKIGVGDGETKEFDFSPEASNIAIKIDNNIVTECDIINENYPGSEKKLSLSAFIDKSEDFTEALIYDIPFISSVKTKLNNSSVFIKAMNTYEYAFKSLNSLKNMVFWYGAAYTNTSIASGQNQIKLMASSDGQSFSTLFTLRIDSASNTLKSAVINTDNLWFKIELTIKGSNASERQQYCCYLENPSPIKLDFDNPPADGALITADFTVPYIPKSTNYILDIEFVLQFGEGV